MFHIHELLQLTEPLLTEELWLNISTGLDRDRNIHYFCRFENVSEEWITQLGKEIISRNRSIAILCYKDEIVWGTVKTNLNDVRKSQISEKVWKLGEPSAKKIVILATSIIS